MLLKKEEMIERETEPIARITFFVKALRFAELVVCVNEDGQHCSESFQTSEKALVPSLHPCDI